MSLRVRALGDDAIKWAGYYNSVRRAPGAVFDLLKPADFSERWMEKVEDSVEKTPAPGEPSKADLVVDGQLTQDEADGKFEEPAEEEATKDDVAPKSGRGRANK